jgi:predicted PhzF superfamily epimerase YddE/YHI9
MTELRVLRVFVGPDGRGGNPLGVVLDGIAVPAGRRQAVAAELGFSETVFVDDAATGAIRIFTPGAELPFAGHPTVGTGWLLRSLGLGGSVLRPPAGDVWTWQDDGLSWIRARPEWIHPITRARLSSPTDVDALTGTADGEGSYYAWAWIDEGTGVLRSRYFAGSYGIGEDEATGAAAVMMGGLLRRTLEIRQGAGSVLHVRPGPDGRRGRRSGGARRDPGAGGVSRPVPERPDPAVTLAGPSPAAFHYGPAHLIVHGNGAFIAAFGADSIGMPAREAMTDLPGAAFKLMDRVFREGRPLARRVTCPRAAAADVATDPVRRDLRRRHAPADPDRAALIRGIGRRARSIRGPASPNDRGSPSMSVDLSNPNRMARTAFEASLPRAAYVDEAFLERERESIWWAEWVAVGRVEQLRETGDFLSVEVSGERVIVVRDRAGSLHAHASAGTAARGSRPRTIARTPRAAMRRVPRAGSRVSSGAGTTPGAMSWTDASATPRSSANRVTSMPVPSDSTRSPSTPGAAGCS